MTLVRDALARQTAAWLFTMSEDENRVIANVVDRVRGGAAQYGNLDIRADKRDWQNEAGAEILDFLFYVGCEWLKQRLARVDELSAAPGTVSPDGSKAGGGTFRDGGKHGERRQTEPHVTQQGAATPGQGASLAAGNVAEPQLTPGPARSERPSSQLFASARHGAQRDAATPTRSSGHETPSGGTFSTDAIEAGLAELKNATVVDLNSAEMWSAEMVDERFDGSDE